jgi:hypothetical protein
VEEDKLLEYDFLFIFSDFSIQLSHATTWWVTDYCRWCIYYALVG